MLAMGMVIPLTGVLGEKFGLKTMYIFALTTFTIGSAMCALSWGLPSMIVARVVQAVGGGMIMPISMTYIYRIVPRKKIGLAMGFWGIAVMAAPAIGPTLGGYLVETVNWQFIFAINIPIGIVSVLMSIALLIEFKSDTHVHIDYAGAITICIGLFTLLLGLNKGNAEGWTSPLIVGLFFVAFISLISFIFIQLNVEKPLLDLSVLKHYPFTLSLFISIITTFALFGGIFMIPIFLQTLQGYTALQAGMLMFPPSVATALVMPISGKLFDKFGAKYLVMVGMIILTVSTYLLSSLTLDSSYFHIMGILIIRSIGLGAAMMPIQTYGMTTIPTALIGKASALSNTIRQVSGSLGIAILSSVLTHQRTVHAFFLSQSFNPNAPLVNISSSTLFNAGLKAGLSQESSRGVFSSLVMGHIMKQAFLLGINDTFVVSTIIAATGVIVTLFIGKTIILKHGGEVHSIAVE